MAKKSGKTVTNGICRQLKDRRGFLKRTQGDMAKSLGWSRRRYVSVEGGSGRMSMGEMLVLCEMFKVKVVLVGNEYVLPASGEKDV
jgi:DNA-binding XRE family transcriptional regulator